MSFTDFVARLRRQPMPAAAQGLPPPQTYVSKGLSRFLTALEGRTQPVLLDLGPVVGSNVTFFGEELGCKIFVEDLAADLDRHVREDRVHELAAFFASRFPLPDESADGIVCWDVFDFLDRAAAQALAEQLVRRLRPDGALLAFFHQRTDDTGAVYTRHVVSDRRTLEQRPYPAARGRQRPLLNRDIQRMFAPLSITDQYLLKTNVREVVFRKPAG